MLTNIVRRGLSAVVISMAALLGLTGVAFAEGYFASKMTHVLAGFESRTWRDNNADGTYTTLRLTGCRPRGYESATVVVRLFRERTGSDENMGQRTFNCW